MKLAATQSARLEAVNITSHVNKDGLACLDLGTGSTAGQSILIWAGGPDADLAGDAAALLKLARVASDLADGLKQRLADRGDER
ncbi:MAG TPA: hypothetical protein VLW50_34455 [Streptosporangiaceae bacterium]|nr:hypothetical protein [Streptosporangiaceae bacterium]